MGLSDKNIYLVKDWQGDYLKEKEAHDVTKWRLDRERERLCQTTELLADALCGVHGSFAGYLKYRIGKMIDEQNGDINPLTGPQGWI